MVLIPSPSYEDRVKQLCAQLAITSDEEESAFLLAELKRTIREHAKWVKAMAEQSAKAFRNTAA